MCRSCQIAMADGTVEAGALKTLAYYCKPARHNGGAELAGLWAALGKPHLVQCLAAFQYQGADNRQCLAIVTK